MNIAINFPIVSMMLQGGNWSHRLTEYSSSFSITNESLSAFNDVVFTRKRLLVWFAPSTSSRVTTFVSTVTPTETWTLWKDLDIKALKVSYLFYFFLRTEYCCVTVALPLFRKKPFLAGVATSKAFDSTLTFKFWSKLKPNNLCRKENVIKMNTAA